jgi:hypothetical protein
MPLFSRPVIAMPSSTPARDTPKIPMLQIENLRARICQQRQPVAKIGLAPIAEKHNNAAVRIVAYNIFETAMDIWRAGRIKRTHRVRLQRLREDMRHASALHWNPAEYAQEVSRLAEDSFRTLARLERAHQSDRQSAFAYFVCACELTRHVPSIRPIFGILGMYVMAPPKALTNFVNECLTITHNQRMA